VNPDGTWSFTPSTPLPDGTYQMTVRSTNGSGGVTLSSETSLTIDTKPATVQILNFGAKVRDTSVNSLSFKFSEAVKNVQLDDLVITRDGQPVSLTSAKLSTQDNQIFTLNNIPGLTNQGGNYQISIKPSSTITDLAGNSLMVGNSDTWLTGFTADALPAARRGGKRGLVVSDFGGKNFVMGSMNRDVMRGLGGNDTLFGFGGNDRQVGGAGKDKLSGGGGNDQLLGGTGNDNCRGRNGHDTLMGAVGRDRLLGNNGNDVLIGGGGKDILNGGAGRDTFRVDTIEKVSDRVVDFNSASDLIDLRGIFKSAQFAADNRFAQYHQYTKLVQVGANIEVQVDGDGKGSNTTFSTVLTLQNTLASNVKSTNFVIG
jgi:Ca2+-binding RTX toxin-like protein